MSGCKSILLFTDWYKPGFRAGGPIQSCVNFVDNMSGNFVIYVFTSDRDLNQDEPYNGILLNQWVQVKENVSIYYADPQHITLDNIRKNLEDLRPDFIYLNSMFSPGFTIKPLLVRYFRRTNNTQVILSPRGMLRISAMSFRRIKKLIFLKMFKLLGVHRLITFHATDEIEMRDIISFFPQARVVCIPNFPKQIDNSIKKVDKIPGNLKLLYVGRVHPIKNLHLLMKILNKVSYKIELTVVGAEEDADYTALCKSSVIHNANIIVNFKGELIHEEVEAIIQEHHALALLTSGENFGHAIFETFSKGRPVVISDQTPWRNLDSCKAGWDIAIGDEDSLVNIFNELALMNQQSFDELCIGALNFAQKFVRKNDLSTKYKGLFNGN